MKPICEQCKRGMVYVRRKTAEVVCRACGFIGPFAGEIPVVRPVGPKTKLLTLFRAAESAHPGGGSMSAVAIRAAFNYQGSFWAALAQLKEEGVVQKFDEEMIYYDHTRV